ncbi:MAG: NAD(P)H-binding protein [Casimicrobium sp.]
MNKKTTAIVIGATGLTGRALVAQLARDERYEHVVACVRKPAEFGENVATHLVDFDALIKSPEAFARSFEKLAASPTIHAFCCLGTTIKVAGSQEAFRRVDFDSVIAFAKAMKLLGAAHIGVVSALGASKHSSVFYSRVKAEMEEAVTAIGIASTNFLRPSFLDGDRAEHRPGEKLGIVFTKLIGPLLLGSLRRYRVVHAQAVAATFIREANAHTTGVKINESETILH